MSDNRNSAGGAILIAALILAVGWVAGAYVISGSVNNASERLEGMRLAMVDMKGAIETSAKAAPVAAAAPAPRRRGPDPDKRYTFKSLGNAVKGGKDAKVTIVEFSDFQCPFCKRVNPTLAKIEETYGDKVKIAFKHLPLDFHSKAPAAAAATIAAGNQGKFWEMHDKIFENQSAISPANYEKWAGELGLDVAKFKKDSASPAVKAQVDADKKEAASLGVTGTPSFFINGRYLSGAQPFEAFQRLIDEELKG